MEYLAYADGDDKVNAAITVGNAPDLVMEGPERLVANRGANGHMVDLADIQALEKLYATDGIDFDASLEGGDEIAKFYQGIFKMAFCWNIAQQLNPNSANTGVGLTQAGEEIAFMSFPSQDGKASLNGGISGTLQTRADRLT